MTKEDALKILDTIPTIGEQVDALEMAIEALSAQLEPIKLHVDYALTKEEIKSLKQKMADSPMVFIPSTEPELQWIPCSERLPETDEVMLVTAQPKKGAPNVNRAYYMNGHWHGSGSMSNVVAWMPLPEPYIGGGEE